MSTQSLVEPLEVAYAGERFLVDRLLLSGSVHDPVVAERVQQAQGGHLWVVRRGHGFSALNRDGEWEVEPMPSNRTADYLGRTRFPTLSAALDVYLRFRESNG